MQLNSRISVQEHGSCDEMRWLVTRVASDKVDDVKYKHSDSGNNMHSFSWSWVRVTWCTQNPVLRKRKKTVEVASPAALALPSWRYHSLIPHYVFIGSSFVATVRRRDWMNAPHLPLSIRAFFTARTKLNTKSKYSDFSGRTSCMWAAHHHVISPIKW